MSRILTNLVILAGFLPAVPAFAQDVPSVAAD